MSYCPNCSAYQVEEGSEKCIKCGYDIKVHREKLKKEHNTRESEKGRSEIERMKVFDDELSCPECQSPSRLIDDHLEIQHEGKRIEIYGVKLMGGDITKKTVVLYQMDVKGVQCSQGHQFFIDVSSKARALCPLCNGPLFEYGSSLYSCTRCKKHFPMNEWDMPSAETVLLENGWFEAD